MNEERRSESSLSAEPEYILGHTQAELARLMQQAAYYERQTRLHLVDAGLSPGQHVIDFGCGVGDVAFLAARLVGPSGRVVGADRSKEAVLTARYRARQLGLANVEFICADDEALLSCVPTSSFDAVVGRMVLMYQSDPTLCLKRLATLLRPGGVVMFQEVQMALGWQGCFPPSPTFQSLWRVLSEAIKQAGVELNMGLRLRSTMLQAGLAHPACLLTGRVDGGADSPVYDYLAETIRSLVPAIVLFQIATAAEIDVDTLADRLRAEVLAHDGVIVPSMLVGAIAHRPALESG